MTDARPALTRMNPPGLPAAGRFGHSQITVAEPGRTAFLGGAWPSLTGIGVAALADPAFEREVEMVVRLPG